MYEKYIRASDVEYPDKINIERINDFISEHNEVNGLYKKNDTLTVSCIYVGFAMIGLLLLWMCVIYIDIAASPYFNILNTITHTYSKWSMIIFSLTTIGFIPILIAVYKYFVACRVITKIHAIFVKHYKERFGKNSIKEFSNDEYKKYYETFSSQVVYLIRGLNYDLSYSYTPKPGPIPAFLKIVAHQRALMLLLVMMMFVILTASFVVGKSNAALDAAADKAGISIEEVRKYLEITSSGKEEDTMLFSVKLDSFISYRDYKRWITTTHDKFTARLMDKVRPYVITIDKYTNDE